MFTPIHIVGDIHLGRTPDRLRGASGYAPTRLGPAEAWRRVVDTALAESVQAVVLAGDVVDQDQDRFEAWSILRDGVARLVGAGVRVMGVAGNHDHLALPRLAARIPDFHLLGANGHWERVALDGLDLVGWSFPTRHHRQDPLLSPGLRAAVDSRRPGIPAIGVLHADLDAARSPYAPVRSDDLRAQGLDGWLLGHIHQPDGLGNTPPLGYLGSLVGLDRGEEGRRGPWRLTPGATGGVALTQLPLGPVLWKTIQADVSGIEPGDDAVDRMTVRLEGAIAEAAQADAWMQDGSFDVVGVTLTLVGRTSARAAIRELGRLQEDPGLSFPAQGVAHFVVRIQDETRPAIDLAALAQERTPLGRLAALLRDLDDTGAAAIPAPVLTALSTFDPGPWTPDPDAHPPPPDMRVVRRAAQQLFDQLVDQRGQKEGC